MAIADTSPLNYLVLSDYIVAAVRKSARDP
jgi:hypothetical protein